MSQQPVFADRHVGPRPDDVARMLERVGFDSLDDLMGAAVPAGIASRTLDLPEPLSEYDAARELRRLADLNHPVESMIGVGYHATITPGVIRRNVLEDPSWYTAYTPYQPEISQGRLEALLNFQTVIGDLTGLPTANASLLDEGTAAAEAMTLVRRAKRSGLRSVRGRRRRAAADDRGRPHPGRGDGHRRRRGGPGRRPSGRRPVRRARAVPRRLRPHPRPAADHRGGARARRARRGRRRPARADPARVARPARRRCRRGVVTAVRRPDVLRRPARRLHVRRRRPGAAPARTTRRRLGRRRGPPGVPPRAADTRAAHPTRQGDVQHLHRPGPPGGGGVDVRRVPRARGSPRDRDPDPPARPSSGRDAAIRRGRGRARRVLRHGPGPRAWRGERSSRACARGRPAPATRGRRPRGHQRGGDGHGQDRRRSGEGDRGRARDRWLDGRLLRPRESRARPRRTSPTRCSRPIAARRRCCATCAPCPRATTPSTAG